MFACNLTLLHSLNQFLNSRAMFVNVPLFSNLLSLNDTHLPIMILSLLSPNDPHFQNVLSSCNDPILRNKMLSLNDPFFKEINALTEWPPFSPINVYVPTCIHLFPHARTDTIQVVEHEPNFSKFYPLTISFMVSQFCTLESSLCVSSSDYYLISPFGSSLIKVVLKGFFRLLTSRRVTSRRVTLVFFFLILHISAKIVGLYGHAGLYRTLVNALQLYKIKLIMLTY